MLLDLSSALGVGFGLVVRTLENLVSRRVLREVACREAGDHSHTSGQACLEVPKPVGRWVMENPQ